MKLNWLKEVHNISPSLPEKRARIKDMVQVAVAASPLPASCRICTDNDGTSSATYFECKAILASLSKVEGACNIFGQYNFPYLKDWSNILKLWEENSSYLADSAETLIDMHHQYPVRK